MDGINNFRDKLDSMYNPIVYKIIGSLLTCYACKTVLDLSVFKPLTVWVFAVVVGVAFYLKPTFAILLNSVAIFLSFSHINAVMALVLAMVPFLFIGGSYLTAFAAIMLPSCFISTSILHGWEFLFLLFGLCLAAKTDGILKNISLGVFYAFLALTTVTLGFSNYFYADTFNCTKSAAPDIATYFDTLNYDEMMARLTTGDLTILFIGIAILGIYATVAFYIFTKLRIGGKTLAFDISELINFVIMGILLCGVTFGTSMLFKTDYTVPFVAILLQTLLAYIISRPFASEEIINCIRTGKGPMTAGSNGLANAIPNSQLAADTWDSIIGYEATKKEIQDIIRPYTDKKEYEKLAKAKINPIKGMLLFGPPGTGKTTFARIIANETKMKLIVVNASSFLSKWVGESEKNLIQVFKQAAAKAPCIICFDEIEAFLMDRSNSSQNYEKSIVSTFLTQMDGYTQLKDVLVVATSNKPDLIDPAAMRPGRFDKLIFVGAPDIEARAKIFEKYLEGRTTGDIDFAKLAEYSERFTGADIKGFAEAAFMDNGFKPVTQEQLMMRLSNTRPSYTLDMRKDYELWAKKYTRSSIAQADNQKKDTKRLQWSDIKGMDAVKAILKDKIELPLQNADQFKEYGIPASKGILFFGPPGCGKTFFAKVVADECNANFYVVNGPELLGKGIGESEENLRRAFSNARETKPSILFFDEIDAIAESRSNNPGSVKLINQLLTEMDGMESLSGVTVIAATNRPENLDPALMRAGRFDTKVYIPLPDQESIKQMILSNLGGIPCTANIDAVSRVLTGFTCADVVAIVNKAKAIYVKRKIVGEEKPIDNEDFKAILATAQPSISEAELARYEKMKDMESIL